MLYHLWFLYVPWLLLIASLRTFSFSYPSRFKSPHFLKLSCLSVVFQLVFVAVFVFLFATFSLLSRRSGIATSPFSFVVTSSLTNCVVPILFLSVTARVSWSPCRLAHVFQWFNSSEKGWGFSRLELERPVRINHYLQSYLLGNFQPCSHFSYNCTGCSDFTVPLLCVLPAGQSTEKYCFLLETFGCLPITRIL